jgi:hypothetical protein
MSNNNKRKNQGNIRTYRRPFQINIGLIIFGIIFIYILIMVIMYSTSKHISAYEVKTGQLTVPSVYTGLIIREEQTYISENGGYISYFIPESKRIGKGDVVCAISASNEFITRLSEMNDGSSSLSHQDLGDMKEQVEFFERDFTYSSFTDAYDFEDDLEITVSKYINLLLEENLNQANSESLNSNVQLITTSETGVVVYNQDGYENFDMNQITMEDFNLESYESTDFISNELFSSGTVIYKLITNEDWSVVIPIDEEHLSDFEEGDYKKVRFLKDQTESYARIHLLQTEEGHFVELQFTNSMINFANERYLDLELFIDGEEGLKIPNSAIQEKMFFLVPKEYVNTYQQDRKLQSFVMLEYYNEDGVKSVKELPLTIYSESETEYYIDSELLDYGDRLIKDNSTDTFVVNTTGTLIGVYNINKGYADFTQITILSQNDEYSIIKSNTKYGLRDYDYIVLDAEMVEEDDLLY